MKVLFSNILGFDGLIFIAAAVNIWFFYKARETVNHLYQKMHPRINTASLADDIEVLHRDVEDMTLHAVADMQEKAELWYTLFSNLTELFPLLGILGTVISLIGLVNVSADMTGNFFAALTSTFWGLVFAISFKVANSFVVSKLEDAERNLQQFFENRKPGNRQDTPKEPS